MRIQSPFRSFVAWSSGIGLVVASLIGIVVGPAAPAGAAATVYRYTCSSYFTSGVTATNDAEITIGDTSTTPGVADLTVAFPAGASAITEQLHSSTAPRGRRSGRRTTRRSCGTASRRPRRRSCGTSTR